MSPFEFFEFCLSLIKIEVFQWFLVLRVICLIYVRFTSNYGNIGKNISMVSCTGPGGGAIVKMKELNGYNFENWLLSLKMILKNEDAIRAIEEPLSVDDNVNMRSLFHIVNSVPDNLQPYIGGTKVAFTAIENLKNEFLNISITKRMIFRKKLRLKY